MEKKKKQFKRPEYVHFVFTKGANAGYGFTTYVDTVGALGKPGASAFISYQLDKNQRPIPYYFGMGLRDRVIRVEKEKVDMFNTNVVEFLRNHPECKGSPNGTYLEDGTQVNVMFKEMNEEEDANAAISAKQYRLKAENIAASLPLDEVYEINAILGDFRRGESMARHFILEMAGNKPDVFMRAYEDPQRKARALIRRGIQRKVLKDSGSLIIWNKTTLGLDELDAATKLQKDPDLFNALEKAVEQASLS